MKLNRNCPAFELCDENNFRVGEIWGHPCPHGFKSGKRDFTQCIYYEEWVRTGQLDDNEDLPPVR